MTPEEEIARKNKFAAITNDCRTKARAAKFFKQYMNDTLYTLTQGVNKEAVAPSVKVAIDALVPTAGWQKEIYEIFRATVLKELKMVEVTTENIELIIVKTLGLISNINYATNKMAADHDPADALIAEVVSEYYGHKNSPTAEFSEKLKNAQDKASVLLAKVEELRPIPPSKHKELSKEYGRAATAIFDDDLNFAHDKGRAMVYGALLYLDDYVSVFETIEELYDYLATTFTPAELGGLTAFRQLCLRIKLKTSGS